MAIHGQLKYERHKNKRQGLSMRSNVPPLQFDCVLVVHIPPPHKKNLQFIKFQQSHCCLQGQSGCEAPEQLPALNIVLSTSAYKVDYEQSSSTVKQR